MSDDEKPVIYMHLAGDDGRVTTYLMRDPEPVGQPDWGARFRRAEIERAHEEALLENACREYDKTLAWVKAMSDATREALDRLDFATKHFAFSPVPVKPAPGSVFEKNTIRFRDNPDCPTFAVWRPDRDRSAFIDYVPPGGTR